MSLTDTRYYTITAYDERRVVDILRVGARAEWAMDEIARRAGVKGGGTRRERFEHAVGERYRRAVKVDVFFTPEDDTPPTLQWVKKVTHLQKVGGGSLRMTHKKRVRRVIVGRGWLQQHAPELWAAFMAARLHGQRGLIPVLLTSEAGQ